MEKINIGCNGIIIEDKKLLLGLRKNTYGAGTYGLPGGHLEFGEKMTEALKREVKEECGIEVVKFEFHSIVDEAGTRHYIQVNFIVQEYKGKIKCMEPDKCEGWEWFSLDRLPTNIFPPHIPVLEAYKKKLIYS